MYYILVYDVSVNRVASMLKIVRSYLSHVQNSVFEGELTEAQKEELVYKIQKLMHPGEDSVIMYCIGNEKWYDRKVLGVEKHNVDNFL